MTLDRNYSIKNSEVDVYSDEFDKIVDLILKNKESGLLSDKDVAFLLSLAMKKQNKNEIKHFFNLLFNGEEKSEKHTLFIHLKTNKAQYA